ncbi:phage tail tube protein [Chengkuizengella axinellae]|uniref:Phage tail tube protein n=1 Tax=Chengkuizengella axinellae TaxID=3064388 RepID=A0ABT9IW13_9BACL|nr:phage tail tube protein [Chengkuizengella sp. 2205SS18-9]MDP5273548.1 phage tail tube protein [Chengkuizengella sp. 2205SS18-9]
MLDDRKVINGSMGECWHEGVWLTNITSVEASVEISKEEVKRAGTRWTGHKVTSLKGTGTMSGYKITSDWVERIGQIANDRNGEYRTEIIAKLDDPEAYGAYRVRLKDVSFDKIDLLKYEHGALVEEELAFTFSGFDLLDTFKAE